MAASRLGGSQGGLASERQADPAPVARQGPARPPAPTEEAVARDRRPCRGDVPDPAERAVGARLPVRRHRRWPHLEDAQRDRRVHPRVPRDRS